MSYFLLVGANLFIDGKLGKADHVRRGFLDGKPVVVKFEKKGKRDLENEYKVWNEVCRDNVQHFVPLKLLTLSGVS
jgi:hypothetical protein